MELKDKMGIGFGLVGGLCMVVLAIYAGLTYRADRIKRKEEKQKELDARTGSSQGPLMSP